MSIKAPNYDKLPSRQAAKRAEKRTLKAIDATVKEAVALALTPPEATTLDPTERRGRPPVIHRKAKCHPRRAEAANGLCRMCLTDKINRREKADLSPEQALEKVSKDGAGEVGKRVRAVLVNNLDEYARLHLEACRVGALRGEGKGMEWALQSIKAGDGPVVTPPAKDGGGGGGGVRVYLGFNLGSLPPGVTPEAITVDSVTDPPVPDTNRV